MCMCTTPNRANCAAFLSPINAGPESLIPQGSDPSAVFYPLLSLRRGLDSVTTWGHFFSITMLAHFPSNCSLISTSLTRCVVSNGTTFTEQVCRCVPNMEAHSIRLYALGHTSKVLYRPACITSGVNTREVHEYNVSTGWALPDERTEEEREAESIRTSVSRSVRMVRELAACNQWQFLSL